MRITYAEYLDRVRGGWLGKSIGGAVGARFEGNKNAIDIKPQDALPPEMPPNDDLDLQVLWLSVLEEKGPAITSDDLADAWLEKAWYPFNEYGNFRRNHRLGIRPPYSGRFNNEFFETGMGCPIRSEIWGYIFPGAPDLAARFARMDGCLDHGEQAIGAEQMLSAMAAMAFFVRDVRRLIDMAIHYLPTGSNVESQVRAAMAARDEGLSLADARKRLIVLGGHPEACDVQLNVPFAMLGLLYGQGDMTATLLGTLSCGYDTDCTCATAVALLGQIAGAAAIPAQWRDPVGDDLVMGIEYRREELTLSALARDTARIGVLMGRHLRTGVEIADPPSLVGFPSAVIDTCRKPRLRVDYPGVPAAGPGEHVPVVLTVEPSVDVPAEVRVAPPDGWRVLPPSSPVGPGCDRAEFTLVAPPGDPVWPNRNIFAATLARADETIGDLTFGVAGAGLYRVLGVHFDPAPTGADRESPSAKGPLAERSWKHHFVAPDREYIEWPVADVDGLYEQWSKVFGCPAMLIARTFRIIPEDLIGLRGQYCLYLAREIISPDERDVNLVVGNNDGYRIHVNGDLVADVDEQIWWAPQNAAHVGHLRAGRNLLLLRLLKRGERLDFTLGIRNAKTTRTHHFLDWIVDLADGNPLAVFPGHRREPRGIDSANGRPGDRSRV